MVFMLPVALVVFPFQKWVKLEDAEKEIQQARREVVEIDEDCVMLWRRRFLTLANEFGELYDRDLKNDEMNVDEKTNGGKPE